MSPRLTSRSSASRIVTDIGGERLVDGSPPGPSIAAIVDVKPDGSTTTSSPGLNTPPATVPA